jgi:hypothetical protein
MHSTSGPPATSTPTSSADCAKGSPSMGTMKAPSGKITASTSAVIPA